MRWTNPSRGDKRTRTAFLWRPKTISGETRFWETATWEEEVSIWSRGWRVRIGNIYYFMKWRPTRWLE